MRTNDVDRTNSLKNKYNGYKSMVINAKLTAIETGVVIITAFQNKVNGN